MILQTWRKEMPKDILEDELPAMILSFQERPNSAVHEKNLPVYRESFSCVSDNFNALEEYCQIPLDPHQFLAVT